MDNSAQFFPNRLKWFSLSFFAVVIAGATVITLTSPQTLSKQSKSQTNLAPKPLNQEPQVKSASNSATSHPLSASTEPQSQSITSSPDVNENQADQSNVSTSTSPPQSSQALLCNNTRDQQPIIKGIVIEDKKYYYTPGGQEYLIVEEHAGPIQWFCTARQAEEAGWAKAPQGLLRHASDLLP